MNAMKGCPPHLQVFRYGIQNKLDLLLCRLRPGCDLCAAVCMAQQDGVRRWSRELARREIDTSENGISHVDLDI